MKSISIAMATYNGARFIGEQLESLACQTILPAEIVVTDDNSTDNTVDIIHEFASRVHIPVRIEKNTQRLGYRANFMKAAELCTSDLISFCDQDDVWLSNKLEKCLASFENDDVLLTYHNAIVSTADLQSVVPMHYSAAPQAMNPASSLEPWKNGGWGFTVVIDRFLLNFSDLWTRSVDVYELHENEKHDQWFFFLASCLGTIAYIDEQLALYRQHGQNAVSYQGAPSMQSKLEILLTNDMGAIQARSLAGGRRAYILEEMFGELGELHRTKAEKAAAGYRQLAANYEKRQEIYASRNILSRSRRLISLSRFGGYRPRTEWGVGRQAFVRDVIRGILLPSRQDKAQERQKTAT